MSDPYFNNELMLAAMGMFTTSDASFTDAEQAFLQTRGDFKARLTAALRIMTIAKLKPEKFFAIPEDLESLSKQELVDLFPPDGGVFVRSNASKDDLRDALRQISRRQRERPRWMPRTPDSAPGPAEADQEAEEAPSSASETVPGSLAMLPEIGTIATRVPAWYEDPVYVAGDASGPALQLTLLAALGIGPDTMPERTIIAEDPIPSPFTFFSAEDEGTAAPEGAEQPVALSAEDGLAAVIELLATTRTLGGLPVKDESAEGAIGVLLTADGWWHSPAIVMDTHSPFGLGSRRTIARASSAEWTDTSEGRVGFVVLVNVASADSDGIVAAGAGDLHQFILWWETSSDESATREGSWHRLVQHCTGEDSCLRNGCPASGAPEVGWLAAQVASEATAVASMLGTGDWAAKAYLRTLADPNDPSVYEEQGGVMWIAEGILESLGWHPVNRSSWDIGDQDLLLYRSGHVLLVRHHATHRELSVSDGMEELTSVRDMLEEEEEEEPGNAQDQSATPAYADRDARTEAAALDECLRLLKADAITPLTNLQHHSTPLLCLWPWGDGQPHTEHSHERIQAWLKHWLPSLPGIS